ncbi:hypothetical protein [Falsiroseomonas selenitidurans]|uniref:Uncharacterized protein n=1 Tax=Falsiroseomonas selenitidurans TaxID=2716335 RepID=A0ABX1E8F0_9PROT|nr:hypothetical protein [Falsiroseomonas selenitidurans]NKC33481.1 hypothetical protein [Falsiroseomonas selenitidurans]
MNRRGLFATILAGLARPASPAPAPDAELRALVEQIRHATTVTVDGALYPRSFDQHARLNRAQLRRVRGVIAADVAEASAWRAGQNPPAMPDLPILSADCSEAGTSVPNLARNRRSASLSSEAHSSEPSCCLPSAITSPSSSASAAISARSADAVSSSIPSSMVGLGNPMVEASGAGPQRPAPDAGLCPIRRLRPLAQMRGAVMASGACGHEPQPACPEVAP